MKYPSGMAIGEAADQLEQEELQEKKRLLYHQVTYPVNRRTPVNVNVRTLTLFMARMPPQSSMYCLRSFSRYSKTSVRDLSVCTMSWRVTEEDSSG